VDDRTAGMRPLDEGTAHLWYVLADDVREPELLRACRALMAPAELEEEARFLLPEGRHLHLVTRALVRSVLSRYAPVDPRDWSFVRNAHGRPELVVPAGVPPLRFNLSHTAGMVACVVALDRDVGVDVEDATRALDPVELGQRVLSPVELASLRACSPEQQKTRFFELWTLKESYAKARGLGLTIPFEQVTVRLEPGPAVAVTFGPGVDDVPEHWQFELARPTARHVLAAAVHKGSGAPLAIELGRTLPLAGGRDHGRP
jgi:4'-phosphopantetheinyl transferase